MDDKGIVILMIDEKVSKAAGKEIVQGKADPINSAFHLTYNMVLNLVSVCLNELIISLQWAVTVIFYAFMSIASCGGNQSRIYDGKIFLSISKPIIYS